MSEWFAFALVIVTALAAARVTFFYVREECARVAERAGKGCVTIPHSRRVAALIRKWTPIPPLKGMRHERAFPDQRHALRP